MIKWMDQPTMENLMINRERMVKTFMDLVHINSPSLSEEGVAHYLKKELTQLGLGFMEDSASASIGGKANNLLFTYRPPETDRFIHFNAHMDTVAPTLNIQPLIKDGIIRTDGTTVLGADDKAGIAIMIEVARLLREQDFNDCGVEFLFLAAEEIGLRGARAFDTSKLQSKFGYSLDSAGSVGTIIYQAPYHNVMEVELVGKSAHAGIEPERGISAIAMAAQVISKLPLGRVDEETTANIGIIQGGSATNIITERVYLKGETRSRNREKIDSLSLSMKETFEAVARQMGGSCKVTIERHYSGYRLKDESPVIQTALKSARNIGLSPELKPTGGGSDASIFNEKGFPCAVLGLNYKEVHTANEHMDIEDLIKGAEYVLSIIQEFSYQKKQGQV